MKRVLYKKSRNFFLLDGMRHGPKYLYYSILNAHVSVVVGHSVYSTTGRIYLRKKG